MPTLNDEFRNKAHAVIADAADAKYMSPDAFAYYTSIYGVEPYGPLYNQVYILANPRRPVPTTGPRAPRSSRRGATSRTAYTVTAHRRCGRTAALPGGVAADAAPPP